MSRPIPNFLFHIPHTGNMLSYDELEQRMAKRHHPDTVHVIDATMKIRKRLGSMPASMALVKFR
jgi:hypothetical protein